MEIKLALIGCLYKILSMAIGAYCYLHEHPFFGTFIILVGCSGLSISYKKGDN